MATRRTMQQPQQKTVKPKNRNQNCRLPN